MKHTTKLKLCALLAPTLLLSSVQAHEQEVCPAGGRAKWDLPHVGYRFDVASFPPGGSIWETRVRDAMAAWSRTASQIYFAPNGHTALASEGNGKNEIFMADLGPGDDDGLTLGYCQLWTGTNCRILEADIVFNTSAPASTSSSKNDLASYSSSSDGTSFLGTAIHELGHAQGLEHELDTYNVLGQGINGRHVRTNGSTAVAYVGEDAAKGSMSIYGVNSADSDDLAVVHWRYGGLQSTTSSRHERTRIFPDSTTSVPLPGYSLSGSKEPMYRVRPGQSISLELTFENIGRRTRSTVVHFYLSENDYISTGDIYLGSRNMTLWVNTVNTVRTTLNLPSNLELYRGYSVGAFIDPNNELAEVDENNNRTYTDIYVEP